MPTSRLPDINSAFTKHRDVIIRALKDRDFSTVLGELNAYNGLLPIKKRIRISSDEYAEQTKTQVWFLCECGEKTPYDDTYQFAKTLNAYQTLIRGKCKVEVWRCMHCNKVTEIAETKIRQDVIQHPVFLQVVPDPPRLDQIYSMYEYQRAFVLWAWAFLGELDHWAAEYRDENWIRGNDETQILADLQSDET